MDKQAKAWGKKMKKRRTAKNGGSSSSEGEGASAMSSTGDYKNIL